jgi:TolB-like protein/Flp pilus assembly protein TadD
VQIATQVFPFFEVPNSAVRWTVLVIVAGFPVALVLAWLFDLTPQGIVRTPDLGAAVETAAVTEQRRTMDRKLNYLLGALLLAGAVYLLLGRRGGASPSVQPASTAVAADKSIAVLPFDNLSDDKSNAYFAEGIQEEILTRLAGIADLKVISRTSTEKYRSHPDNLKTVAAELGVGTVLEGSVQKAGDTVRVNVQLIDARADEHLWAQTYDRELKNVFAVESAISQDIADALKARLSPVEASALAKAPTANAAAYDAFLKAEYLLHKAIDSSLSADFRAAEAAYRQALVLDPGFALAAAQLAYCMLNRHWFSEPLAPAELAEASRLADQALALAPELAQAHLAVGYYHYWGFRDYRPALREFQRALELQPNSAQAIAALGFVQRRQGHWVEASRTLAKAVALAPRDDVLIGNYGQTYLVMRDYDKAIPILQRALAIDPESMQTRIYLAIGHLLGDGDMQAALRAFEDLPLDRKQSALNAVDGDVMNLVNPRVYPYVYLRRYDDALHAWQPAVVEAQDQRRQRLQAVIAIQTLAGRRTAVQGECKEMRDQLETQREHDGDAFRQAAALSWAYLCLERNDDAVSTLRRAAALLPVEKDAWNGAALQLGLAQIDTQTGHFDEALQIIGQLLSIPAGDSLSIARLKADPVWDPLRREPRLQALIAKYQGKAP